MLAGEFVAGVSTTTSTTASFLGRLEGKAKARPAERSVGLRPDLASLGFDEAAYNGKAEPRPAEIAVS